jgi:hypothetical protein
MEKYINNTSLVYNKNGFTTGILFRIQEYILFSFKLNKISNVRLLNIIFPSGILNWNYVAQYIIDQLNEYSLKYELSTLFTYELTNLYLRIKAKPNNVLDENSITFNTSRFNLDINKIFIDLKPTTSSANNNDIIFKINDSINDYFLYYDFKISNKYNLNDLYLMTTYHNIDNTTLQQKVICKNIIDNNTINEKILDFTIIGFDIPSDICISKYSNIDQTFSIENILSYYFTWPIDNVWYHYFNKNLLIDKNSKNSQLSFMYYPQIIPIGTEINLLGNSKFDNDSITYGILSDNSFTGIYGDSPIVESLLLNCSAYNGYSGGPVITNMMTEWYINYNLNNAIDICQSNNGEIIYIIIYTSKYFLYKSINYGKKFIDISFNDLNVSTNSSSILRICTDDSGLFIYISISNTGIYFSSDQGLIWNKKSSITNIRCIDCSYDGSTVIASGSGAKLLYSYNFGTTISELNINTLILNLIKISDTKIIASESLGYLYISDIKNITLTTKLSDKRRLWSSIDIKNKIICATTQRGEVFLSNDNGINFNQVLSLPILNYTSVSIDKTGTNIIISANSFKDTINMDLVINSQANVSIGTKSGSVNKYTLSGDIKINSSYIYISNNSGKNWNKDFSTDVKYIFNKILVSGDYKNIIAIGNFNLGYEHLSSNFSRYFLQSFINNNNYKIIGMLVGGSDSNNYFENSNIALSFHIIHFVLHQIYYKYIELDEYIKNDVNLFIKYVISGFPKVYLGIKYNHFNHNDLITNPALITIFNKNKIFGGLWINNLIKGFNFIEKKYIYDILEPEKKDTISFQNPLINTKLWKIFHKDLSSNTPILLTKIIYFNFWIRDYIMLELGKYKSSNLKTQYDYYDINRERNDTILFVKSEYFDSQRSISDFIYFYYYDILAGLSPGQSPVYNDFVIEYIYFDIKNQIWTIGSEKVSPFATDTRDISIRYPILLYGYEKPNTLKEFSAK